MKRLTLQLACIGLIATALGIGGCSRSSSGHHQGASGSKLSVCSDCHGGPANSAPPSDTKGLQATTLVSVGAHQAHLNSSTWHLQIQCRDCHPFPDAVDSPGHKDGRVDLIWSPLAQAGGSAPSFDSATATCAGVYCHGSTSTGGTVTQPVWTTVDGKQALCGTCHGLPPAAPHPQSFACGNCHGMVMDNLLRFVNPSLHINGVVEVDNSAPMCNTCHGGPANAAPPGDDNGGTATTLVTVGAHQAHLQSSTWHRQIQCQECHVVPAAVGDPGHIDTPPAEVIWGPIARARGAAPAFDRTAATCGTVYCHGATLEPGGTRTNPVWTTVDGTQSACGTCHGEPPQAPHPPSAPNDCYICHGMVVDRNLNFVDASLHINGTVEVTSQTCNSCHGGPVNGAPPVDVTGGNATTLVTVGAHQAHLQSSTWHRQFDCKECHLVPVNVGDPGHIDTPPAEVIWGPFAKAGGASPSFNRTAATCGGVYCHGATLPTGGGSLTTPLWTKVDGTQAACGTCHGEPPAAPHPASGPNDCHFCHGMVVDQNLNFVNVALHINGVVDVSTQTCSSCHGGASNSAPPLDASGKSATTLVTVGAHQAHLKASNWHPAMQCTDCHVVPAAVDSPGHLDAPPSEVVWGMMAKASGAAPAWNHNTATCGGVYCHGATLATGGGSQTKPLWTKVDGTQAACGTCHGEPPAAPHPASGPNDCYFCHGMVVDRNLNFVNASLHINGTVEVGGQTCNSCHGGAANSAPPADDAGGTATTLVTVGAHQAHLQSSSWHRAGQCDDCHVVPATVDAPGHLGASPAEVIWGAVAKAGGAAPVWDRTAKTCAGSFCHGATLPAGGTNTRPVWTMVDGTQSACGTCHGEPPAAPHPASGPNDCHFCHGMVVDQNLNFVNAALHINGVIDVSTQACSTCHGGASNSAPPLDTSGKTANNLVTVGAHQAHLKASNWHLAIQCQDCHVMPATVDAPGHLDAPPSEVIWGMMASASGAAPTWDRSAATCGGVYCHGATLTTGGGTLTTPIWTTVNGAQAACGTCHGEPPPAPHPASGPNDCYFCHGMVVDRNLNFINASLHINGTVEVNAQACNSCHGGAANAAPPTDDAGGAATTLVTVGAHQAHLKSSPWHRAGQCNDCHVVPAAVDSPGHLDASPAEIIWGAIAKAGGAAPVWDRTAKTCAGSFCHGATLPAGGTKTTPVWTKVDGTQSACGTCHGEPPGAPHPASGPNECHVCHGMVVDQNLNFVNAALHINGTIEVSSQACNSCHGGPSNSAPPLDTNGGSAASLVTVGAHQAHLGSSTWHLAIQCDECHVVPATVDAPGHLDPAPSEVIWGSLARASGAAPVWNRAAQTCAGSYCHGATMPAGGTVTTPVWTTVNGSQSACGTCHGEPPGAPHPNSGPNDCYQCHGMVVDQNLAFVNASLHINGTVDVSNLACNSCHGGAANSAPPTDTTGGTATTLVTVGAHQAHLKASNWHPVIQCDECHLVPSTVDAPGHIDAAPSEVIWGAMAKASGANPVWNRSAKTCAGSYCHGATMPAGGTRTTPVWTVVDGTQSACGTCHGLPPAAPHPKSGQNDCHFCHGMVVDQNLAFVNGALHLNGTVETSGQDCSGCHGGTANSAPPTDVLGGTNTTLVTVGAHQAHLQASNWHLAVQCSDCHVVPATVDSTGHLDASPSEVVWSALSKADGAAPTWNRTSKTCAGSYCHGATLPPGGTKINPVWTTVNGTQSACGTCHGLPPAAPHPASTPTECHICHGMVVDQNLNFVNAALHVNGTTEVSDQSCNSCHGGTANSAPPVDTTGGSATSLVTVGAHQAHLQASNWHLAGQCNDCHVVPATVDAPGHIDTPPAEVVWGPLAKVAGAVPTWNRTAKTCAGSYCHGATLVNGAGTKTTPVWTTVNGTQSACTACHGMPPAAPHPNSTPTGCNGCHGMVVDASLSFVAPALHIDGTVQVNGTACDSCHGNPPTPSNQSYAGGGGAHARHVTGLGYSCVTCHGNDGTGPTHNQGNGFVVRANVNIVFDPSISFPGGTTMNNGHAPGEAYSGANPTCTVGCHNPLPGDSPDLANVAIWTATVIGCNECHEKPGLTTPANHDITGTAAVIRTNCQVCHNFSTHMSGTMSMNDPDPADAFSYAGQGINGLCRTCHDGGAGTFFGGQSAPNVNAFWTTSSSHAGAGLNCQSCHGYHGGTSNQDLSTGREEDFCYTCHDGSKSSTNMKSLFTRPSRHPVAAADQTNHPVECVDCHNPHADTSAKPYIADPDPTDAITPSGLNANYCLTCHDGVQADTKTGFTAGAHSLAAVSCMPECHVSSAGVNGATTAPMGPHASSLPSLTAYFEEQLCGNCHAQAQLMSNAGSLTHHHVVNSEQVAGNQPVECESCHEPHLVQSNPWIPVTDPDTGALVTAANVPYDYTTNAAKAIKDNGVFCLKCHDGTWPGAINIAAELASSSVHNSQFSFGSSSHRSHRGDIGANGCSYCHNTHGSTGTSGIQRGRLLYSWLNVRTFPYSGKSSCGTTDSLRKCH